jgi:formate-dependent nitrite reductase membrane component NrfD
MTSTREERFRRRPLLTAFFCGGMGLLFLVSGLSRPSIANMRMIDLVHLLVTGAWLGVTLVVVFMYLVFHRKG